ERAALGRHVEAAARTALWRGYLEAASGKDPRAVVLEGPPRGRLTTVIVVSHDALEMTKRCVDNLRRAYDGDFPIQLVVVDNGSGDGSAEWLAAQPDVELIRNADNAGAPLARNQALARAHGAWIAFLDN